MNFFKDTIWSWSLVYVFNFVQALSGVWSSLVIQIYCFGMFVEKFGLDNALLQVFSENKYCWTNMPIFLLTKVVNTTNLLVNKSPTKANPKLFQKKNIQVHDQIFHICMCLATLYLFTQLKRIEENQILSP